MSASTRPVVAGDHSTLGDELILQISLNTFCFLNENKSPDQATISHIIRLLSLWFMCKNNNRLISDEQKILQTISLQDYVKRLWNHSNTKIPVTIGKGLDTPKLRSKAPHAGQWQHSIWCKICISTSCTVVTSAIFSELIYSTQLSLFWWRVLSNSLRTLFAHPMKLPMSLLIPASN